MNTDLEPIIREAYTQRHTLTATNIQPAVRSAINATIAALNDGSLRVASKIQQQWHTHAWLKEAILLWFMINSNKIIDCGDIRCYDKLPLKFTTYSEQDFAAAQLRAVPLTLVRYGAYLAQSTVLMPSYINIGAYIDSGTMIDTWATIGSCAQIGKNVHISGGTGIGGVLEPIQNNPTIIEDDCFLGARSEIVEGVIIEQGAVIAMGVYLSQSTKIYDRARKTITYGVIPAGAVVVPGSLPSDDGSYNLSCAIIVKQVDTTTQQKTAINELLRT